MEAAVTAAVYNTSPMKLVILENEIAQGDYEHNMGVPIIMTDSEKTQFSNEWRTYREINAQLTNHIGQVLSLVLGQCTKLLQDKMKQEIEWNVVSTSYYPLTLYRLIERTVLAQTEDRYPFAMVYN